MSSRLICILEVGRGKKGGREEGEEWGGGGVCQDLQCRFRICSDALVTIIKILLDLLGTVLRKKGTREKRRTWNF
jgi:hypothetical protein